MASEERTNAFHDNTPFWLVNGGTDLYLSFVVVSLNLLRHIYFTSSIFLTLVKDCPRVLVFAEIDSSSKPKNEKLQIEKIRIMNDKYTSRVVTQTICLSPEPPQKYIIFTIMSIRKNPTSRK